jgi:hypothetical protein
MRTVPMTLKDSIKAMALSIGLVAFGGSQLRLEPALASPEPQKMTQPRYTAGNKLMFPEDYHSWVFVGASIGLSYSEGARDAGPGAFHHVYLQPEAYEHFQRTGKFPEKTLLVMEMYRSEQKVSPNKQGYFEGNRVGIEVALKDHEKFQEGWAYFDFGNGRRRSASAFPKDACWSCHNQHGADDNVFTQFYPILRELKQAKSTGQ